MEIPKIGLGTFKATNPDELEASILYAIEECNYRYIDTAHVYGNEEVIGRALQKILSKGEIRRNELFITTKLWATNQRPERVEEACRNSLKKLQLSYLDLYLMHKPLGLVYSGENLHPKDEDGNSLLDQVDIVDTWLAMEKLVELGLTKKIGVSTFTINMLERLEYHHSVTIQPYVHQTEHHIYLQQRALIEYQEKRGMKLTSFSPLLSGEVGPFGCTLVEDNVLNQVANELGKTPGQVALKFLLQLSPIVNIIPKSVKARRIKENFDLNFTINDEQMSKLKTRNCSYRRSDPFKQFGVDKLSLGH